MEQVNLEQVLKVCDTMSLDERARLGQATFKRFKSIALFGWLF